MANEQIALSFNQGITNVPSDAICDDNALEECMGMVFEDGEHRVIQEPVTYMLQAPRILYIHKTGGVENYITIENRTISSVTKQVLAYGQRELSYERWVYNRKGYLLKPGTWTEDTFDKYILVGTSAPLVESVGKTLITKCDELHYHIWKNDAYVALDEIPEPDIEFCLTDFSANWRDPGLEWTAVTNGIVAGADMTTKTGKEQDWSNLVIGLYSKIKRHAEKKCRFIGPFFVRAAVRMYDGTYTKMTAPILMLPTMLNNTITSWVAFPDTDDDDKLTMSTYSCQLNYKLNNSYADYEDLVDEITIFVSSQVETMDVVGDIPELASFWSTPGRVWHIQHIDAVTPGAVSDFADNMFTETLTIDGILHVYVNIPLPASRSQSSIEQDIKDTSLFYKLADIGRNRMSEWKAVNDVTRDHILENLTEQERLEGDDYYSHTKQLPDYMYTYNNRLYLANVQRTFFDGFKYFMPYDNYTVEGTDKVPDMSWYHVYVTIETDSGQFVIEHSYQSSQKHGLWFYYPDSRAKHVTIIKGTSDLVLFADLEEHVGLNGAFYFDGLPTTGYTESTQTGTAPTPTPNAIEQLPDYLIASEVDNPFVFLASGYQKVGIGTILAITTNTQALSQGQFGQYPILVFTSNGIWAATVGNTGQLVSIHPMSREVCNNTKGIIQTDGAVFFPSEKGLMVIEGATVGCVSQQLSGKSAAPFRKFLETSFIAYDYRDSLLWIFNRTSTVCWIYNIKSGTFAHYDFGTGNVVTNVVNDYPDYLLQIGSSIYSLLRRPNINDDGVTVNGVFTANTYSGQIITRPMKFDNALALKSIRQIMTVKQMEGSMTYRLFASNDLQSWVKLSSLRGMPWKYYKLQFDFSRLKATDRFGGAVIVTQERRTNKLR